jgi:hypothetical protein
MENQVAINTMDTILFDNNTVNINLDTLKRSATHFQAMGMLPNSRPVHHFELIEWLQSEMQDITGHAASIEPITISARHSRRIRIDINETINPKDPCPIERLNIQRLVTRIGLDVDADVNGEKLNPAIAIGYNDKGIELAMGTNIFVCSNMNIFGSNKYSTYGADKIQFEALKEIIKAMFKNWKDTFERDCIAIEKMQNTTLPQHKAMNMLGELYYESMKYTLTKSEIAKLEKPIVKRSILNNAQCNRLSEELITKFDQAHLDGMISYWDFCQAGTENLKPTSNDLVSLYPAVQNFNAFVLEKAEIEY